MHKILISLAIVFAFTSSANAQWWKTVDRWLVDADRERINAVKEIDKALVAFDRNRVNAFNKVSDRLAKFERDIRHLTAAGISEQLWGEGGRAGYVSAAKIMQGRSPNGEPLSEKMKAHLRPHYGDLVDRVKLHWGVAPLDAWTASKLKNVRIEIGDVDTAGQTFGYDIYLRDGKFEGEYKDRLELVAHEIAHTKQFVKWGESLSNFGYHYFVNFKKANQTYANNSLEIEAETEAGYAMAAFHGEQLKLQNMLYIAILNRELEFSKPGPAIRVSGWDHFRGWNWDGEIATYVAFDGTSTNLITQPFDGTAFGKIESKIVVSAKDDSFRGWCWDGEIASYIFTEKGKNGLAIRKFDGTTFSPIEKIIPMSDHDLIRGWHWDRENSMASYVGWNGKNSVLYSRSFDGNAFGENAKQRTVSTSNDTWRGWCWANDAASYIGAEPKPK